MTQWVFSILKIDFFPKNWKKLLGVFWFYSYGWWSALWPDEKKNTFLAIETHFFGDYQCKRFLWKSFTLVLKIDKKWFSFCLKKIKKPIVYIDIDFFKFSLLIWVSILKIHIPWKSGVHPFILHYNRLFEYSFHIYPRYWLSGPKNSVILIYLSFVWDILEKKFFRTLGSKNFFWSGRFSQK